MKKNITICLLALCLCVSAQTRQRIAVYVTGEDELNDITGQKLTDALAHDGKYSVVERTASFLAELSKEHGYQRSGAVDEDQISRLGRQMGVQYVCVASVLDVFNEKYLTARIIDVERAEVVSTSSSNGTISSTQEFLSAFNQLADGLLSSLENSKNQKVKKLAVYVTKSGYRDINIVLGDQLVAGFARSGNYLAIERTNKFLEQISKEMGYQYSGAVDDDDIRRIGKYFGVQYVCVAKTSKLFDDYYISSRVIDVEKGDIVNSYQVDGYKLNNVQDVVTAAKTISKFISGYTIDELNGDYKDENGDNIFVVVESMPEFPGGQQALFRYISENLKYPVKAQENGIQGCVICQFVVNKDGSIVDVEVVRSGGDDLLDKEAVRVIELMPRWIPGMQRGKAVRVKYTCPVNFRLI